MATQYLTGSHMVRRDFIAGRVRELTKNQFVTDELFMLRQSTAKVTDFVETDKDPNAQFPKDKVKERGEFGEYPRIAMTETEKAAIIRDYGLEALVSNDAVRFNQLDTIDRAYRKLGGAVVRYVDGRGFRVLTDNYNAVSTLIHTLAVTTMWTDPTAKPWKDAAAAAAKVRNSQYDPTAWVVSPDDWLSLYQNDEFRKALDEDVPADQKNLVTGKFRGRVAGLDIVESANLLAGYSVIAQPKILGSRAQTSADVATDTYPEPRRKAVAVQAFREVVHFLTDPGAVCLLSGTR